MYPFWSIFPGLKRSSTTGVNQVDFGAGGLVIVTPDM